MSRYKITSLKDVTVRAAVWTGPLEYSQETFQLLEGETRDDVALVMSVSTTLQPAEITPIIHPDQSCRRTEAAGCLLIEHMG